MPFISYAQNFEDVMLNRAFRDVDCGFYIDVGAAHPDIDSVTRAFYDRGWHGINIEPSTGHFSQLSAARPHDLNLNLVVGQKPGTALFFEIYGSGLSTAIAAVAEAHRLEGWQIRERMVEQTTLAEICRLHADNIIHFLKIDVEGAELDVLLGADLDNFRPQIILLEATCPGSQNQSFAEWEPILLGNKYHFLWFDGLNRFYVAEEAEARIRPHFDAPPNVFDGFLRSDVSIARELAGAVARASEAAAARIRAEGRELAAVEARLAAERRAARAQTEVSLSEQKAAAADAMCNEMRARLAELEQTLSATTERAARVGSARDTALAERGAALAERDAALAERDAALAERGAALAERDAALAERGAALAERDAALAERDLTLAEVAALRASTSWKLTGPLRAMSRGVIGDTARRARFRRVYKGGGSGWKSPLRLGIYIIGRGVARAPGGPRVIRLAEIVAPGWCGPLLRRYHAYRTTAEPLGRAIPASPGLRPIEPRALETAGLPTGDLSAEESTMLLRLQGIAA